MTISTMCAKNRKRKAVEHAITSYYSSLPEQALDEDKEWAEFSHSILKGYRLNGCL